MTSSLQHAIAAIKSGDRKTGQQVLYSVLQTQPNDEQAWLWMSGVVDSDEQRRACLERVLAINPANIYAQRGLTALLIRWSTNLAAQEAAQKQAQQQLHTDRALFAVDQATLQDQRKKLAADSTGLQQDRATLLDQHEQLIADRTSLEQAQRALQDKQEQLAIEWSVFEQDRDSLIQRTLELTEREDRTRVEADRLQVWSDQLDKREDSIREQELFTWQQQFLDPQHTVLDPPTLKDGIYNPSKAMVNLVNELIKIPYTQSCATPYWQREQIDARAQSIIDKGRADFCKPYMDLSTEDLVLIYCHTNMRMHLYSSYHIFDVHRDLLHSYILDEHQRILFVDLGCGPFTSGLAFNAFTHGLPKKRHLTYIGVDRAPSMLAKAADFNQYDGTYCDTFVTCEDYNQLPEILHEHVGDQEGVPIIVSMSYFFASRNLDVHALAAVMYELTETYKHCPIIFVRQDPDNFSPSEKNWGAFSTYFEHFHSVGNTMVEMFKYITEKERSVKYNILTNQPCGTKGNNHVTAA